MFCYQLFYWCVNNLKVKIKAVSSNLSVSLSPALLKGGIQRAGVHRTVVHRAVVHRAGVTSTNKVNISSEWY